MVCGWPFECLQRLTGIVFTVFAWLAVSGSCSVAEEGQRTRFGFTVRMVPAVEGGKATDAVISYRGPIAYPMAESLADILGDFGDGIRTVTLDLDSDGGAMSQARAVAGLLAKAKARFKVHTRVGHGQRCLSSCLLVFMQGERRIASAASVWMLHGVCGPASNVPYAPATQAFVAELRAAGVSGAFLSGLDCAGFLSQPGGYWVSGYQLARTLDAGVITQLLPDWAPEPRDELPFDPNIRAR